VTARARAVLLRLIIVIGASVGGFILLQEPARWLETHAALGLLQPFAGDRLTPLLGTSIVVIPIHNLPFTVDVTPSCSALASILTLGCLATVLPRTTRARRLGAVSAAIVTVGLGNIIRIASSVGVGLIFGRSSLILFHDWVGSMFTFAYTLGGYVLMLYIVLPHIPRQPKALLDAQPA
jgi:carbamoyl-phosphate synthase large subunit